MSQAAYYPGCALEGTGAPYEKSSLQVVRALDLEVEEVENWNCCGAMEVKNVDPALQTYLSSRTLKQAEDMGYDKVMAPCNGCYHNLKKSDYEMQDEEEKEAAVQEMARDAGEEAYDTGSVDTQHLLEFIMDESSLDEIRDRVKRSLDGVKVANYYGCMYTRPQKIFPDKDQEADADSSFEPHFMDDILEAAGAESVDDFSHMKTQCCGGPHTVSDDETSPKLVGRILDAAEESGADVIATECPTCHSGLEMNMAKIEDRTDREYSVDVMYFTQLLGVALGISPRKLAIPANSTQGRKMLKEKGVL